MSDVIGAGKGFQVTRYAGPANLAVEFHGRSSRSRYRIDWGGQFIDLDVCQARELAAFLADEFLPLETRPARVHDGG